MTNSNEWISEKVLEFVDGGMDAADSSSYISVHLPGLLKDCQRETVKMVLPVEKKRKSCCDGCPVDGYCDEHDNTKWNECRSEILRRASEAGINIEGL